jgi:hypothetical protein
MTADLRDDPNMLRVQDPCATIRPAMSYPRTDLYLGLFEWQSSNGVPRVTRRDAAPPTVIPDPRTGRRLRVSTIQASTPAICPACSCHAHGGFVSFEDDLRIAYACPRCMELIWIKGA